MPFPMIPIKPSAQNSRGFGDRPDLRPGPRSSGSSRVPRPASESSEPGDLEPLRAESHQIHARFRRRPNSPPKDKTCGRAEMIRNARKNGLPYGIDFNQRFLAACFDPYPHIMNRNKRRDTAAVPLTLGPSAAIMSASFSPVPFLF